LWGEQGGDFLRRGLYQTFKKEWIPYLGGEVNVEASASYLYRCATAEKVASRKQKFVLPDSVTRFFTRI
jgi:hypothetical protein